ncbi:GTPase-activating protein [Rhizopus stolonifer]|uniref:GTPase-activating protein n=1 Tax=Rhizopus stolonifer TaxID=4846 RepID=A0A367KBG7_RHIST|nr:GTPase-activating protein [Rhizopus stolonifer]
MTSPYEILITSPNSEKETMLSKDLISEMNSISLESKGGTPRKSMDNESTLSSTSTTRSIFSTFWSPFRSSNTSPASSRRPSKQHSTPLPVANRPSASFAARHLSKTSSIISPLPGFQEALLAQMEQLNVENNSDPKSKMMKSLKRQSIRYSLVTQNKGTPDDYDWDFWANLMCDYDNLSKYSKDLIHHVQFGIPSSIRGMVWQLVSKAKDENLSRMYLDQLKEPSPYDKMIQRDLSRTFPGHAYFKDSDGQGQEDLYNVVKAYSIYDKGVGYCQGLAFIVGPMLLNMPDEDAFCLFVKLMNKYGLRGHFTPEMDGLHLRLYQFDALILEHLPHISRHLNEEGVSSTMYASQWFMTLFAYKFPLNLVFRIYDVVFTEGIDSIFKFAISLLKQNQAYILGLEFEQLDDDRRFVSDACTLNIPLKRLALLEKEYKQRLQKEAAEANTIEDLQKTNRELKKQFDAIQTKTNTLRQESKDVRTQLQKTLHELNSLKDEGESLERLIRSLEKRTTEIPQKIEAENESVFESVCSENAQLIGRNMSLEDRLQKAEATLIETKLDYAQSENEKESLYKKLSEFKKLMG